jgi:hypothetical protein
MDYEGGERPSSGAATCKCKCVWGDLAALGGTGLAVAGDGHAPFWSANSPQRRRAPIIGRGNLQM